MKHILCIHLLNWPIDRLARRLRRQSPDSQGVPVVGGDRRTCVGSCSAPTGLIVSRPVTHGSRHGLRSAAPPGLEKETPRKAGAPDSPGLESETPGKTSAPDSPELETPEKTGAPDSQKGSGGVEVPKAASAPSVSSINNHQSTPPLLIVHAVANRQIVVAAGADALRLGIRPGQTLTEARIHSTNLLVHPWQPADDARGIEALGRYLMRFTPVVATTTCDATDLFSQPPSSSPKPRSGSLPAAIVYLDLTGCEHLFGGLEYLLRTIAQTLARLRIFARLAVAPNPAAAYALTFSPGGNIPVTESASLRDILAPLPIDCLRLDDHPLHLLHQLGIETIGQLLKLPRNQLASRFGRAVLQRLGQALGEIAEPLVPLPCGRPIEGRMDFEGPVSQPEAMEEAFRRVLCPMIEECYRRGQGFRELRINLPRPDEPPLSFSLELSRPTRNARLLLNLFRCAMEQQQQRNSSPGHSSRRGASSKGLHSGIQPLPPPSPKGEGAKRPTDRSLRYIVQPNFDAAFLGLQLSGTRLNTLGQQQASMVETDQQADMEQWQETLDRLRIRFGPDSIVQAQLVESHLPEHAFKLAPADEPQRQSPRRLNHETETSASTVSPHRPLTLLPTPQEIRVTVSPSDDRDGRPIQFGDEDGFHRVVHWVGPERISGEWWEGRNKTRDYFDVEDEAGRRQWIFRVHETGRWFLHGVFA